MSCLAYAVKKAVSVLTCQLADSLLWVNRIPRKFAQTFYGIIKRKSPEILRFPDKSGKPTARGYNAPCFAGVVHCFMGSGLKRRDNGTSGTKCGVLPRGLLSDAPFSVNRRFPLSKFYPGCLLNTPNKRAKTHACVFNARVRFLFYRAIHGSCAFSHQ